MRARDLAEEYQSVRVDSQALDAARLMADKKLPGLLVLDQNGEPTAILPASQMVKALVPAYVLEDPNLAGVVDERHADRLSESLRGRQVGECLPSQTPPPPVARPDDTALEVAALMAALRSPIVAVAERDDRGFHLIGVITAAHLLSRLLAVSP